MRLFQQSNWLLENSTATPSLSSEVLLVTKSWLFSSEIKEANEKIDDKNLSEIWNSNLIYAFLSFGTSVCHFEFWRLPEQPFHAFSDKWAFRTLPSLYSHFMFSSKCNLKIDSIAKRLRHFYADGRLINILAASLTCFWHTYFFDSSLIWAFRDLHLFTQTVVDPQTEVSMRANFLGTYFHFSH